MTSEKVSIISRVSGKLRSYSNQRIIQKAKAVLAQDSITVISQNCIGGVFCHDMGLQFCSPTVNLFIPQPGFIRFVNHLETYIHTELDIFWDEQYPVGRLDDVEIHFVHYNSCQEAAEAWERRKQRIDYSRIVVFSTDRDGFNDEVFSQWKQISYPKVLFTANPIYAQEADSVFFPKYEKLGFVSDLIPKREFYKNAVLINTVNRLPK